MERCMATTISSAAVQHAGLSIRIVRHAAELPAYQKRSLTGFMARPVDIATGVAIAQNAVRHGTQAATPTITAAQLSG